MMRLLQPTSLLIAFYAVILAAPSALPVNAFAGSLTGDVFVTMRSSDVKRAADVDVLIVPATPEFDAEWERLQSEYEERVKPIAAEHDSLSAQQESLRLSQSTASRSRDYRAALQISQQIMGLSQQNVRIGEDQWRPLQQEYTQAALRLLTQRATTRVPTDVNGHFEVKLDAGRYYVFCRYVLPREVAYWLLPTQVQDDAPAKVSLSNRSATKSPLRGRTYSSY
jgi:hypothetical protein